MFKLTILIGAFLTIFLVKSSSSIGIQYISSYVNPDYPGKCFFNDTQTAIEVGSTYKPKGECKELKCRDDFVISVSHCPRYTAGKNCHISFDKEAEYPDCCAKIRCPNVSQF